MILPDIDTLTLLPVTGDVLCVQYTAGLTPFNVTEGLIVLPKEGRNRGAIALDVNVPPDAVAALIEAFGPVGNYISTSGRINHATHLHAWESAGTIIHAPKPECIFCTDQKEWYRLMGCNERMKFSRFRDAIESLGYRPLKAVTPYRPGNIFRFDNLVVGTMPFKGSSSSHVGLMLVNERIFHIGTLGCDNERPVCGGMGPVCGYRGCDVPKYGRDIDFLKTVFLEHADYLTGTGTSLTERPDITPFEYMTSKLESAHNIILEAYNEVRRKQKSPKKQLGALLERELLFPRGAVPDVQRGLYESLEYWTIRNHLGM